MGANLITWSGQTVTPQYDALVFGLSALDGIIYGVDIMQSASDPNIINVSNGYGIIQGRFFTIEEFSVNVELTTGATYQGQLILHMDLSNADEPISVVVDTGATIRSLIKDADVNIVNGIYEMQLCTFIVDAAAVTDIAITYPKAITFNSIMDHNPIAESEISPALKNHSAGEYIVYNGKLYRVTSAIVTGGTLEEGTNLENVSIGGELGRQSARMTWNDVNVPNNTWITHTGGTGVGINGDGGISVQAYNLNLIRRGKFYVWYKVTFKDSTNKNGLRGIRFYIGEQNSGEEFVAPAGNNTTINTFRFIDTSNLSNTNIRMGLYQTSGGTISATNIQIYAIYLSK